MINIGGHPNIIEYIDHNDGAEVHDEDLKAIQKHQSYIVLEYAKSGQLLSLVLLLH